MRALDMILDRFERWVIGVGFLACLVLLTVSVTSRYLLRWPLSFSDELSTYLFILISYLGASAAVRNDTELRVDALAEALPKWRKGLDLLVHLARLIAAGLFIVLGYQFVIVEWEFKAVTPILEIPFTIINGMLPLFGVMLVLRTVLRVNELWRKE